MNYSSIENLSEYEIKMLYDDNLMISGNCTNFYVRCDDGHFGYVRYSIGSFQCGALPWITVGWSYYDYNDNETKPICGTRQKGYAIIDSCGSC